MIFEPTMDYNFLKHHNFVKPNIQEYTNRDFVVEKQTRMVDGQNCDILVYKQNNQQWMSWNTATHQEIFELYSHYCLAKGHCICTGMGFLLRENWLLNNNNVSKITVIEKNKNIIEYHRMFNPEILEKIEVINEDVYTYKGKCDTLLIDNFEGHQWDYKLLKSVNKICNNIDHSLAWTWPMEYILSLYYKNYIGMTLSEIYNNIKTFFDLKTFPNLNEEELLDFCHKYHCGDFYRCNFEKLK